jgi:hypothetical protein
MVLIYGTPTNMMWECDAMSRIMLVLNRYERCDIYDTREERRGVRRPAGGGRAGGFVLTHLSPMLPGEPPRIWR